MGGCNVGLAHDIGVKGSFRIISLFANFCSIVCGFSVFGKGIYKPSNGKEGLGGVAPRQGFTGSVFHLLGCKAASARG